MAFQAVFLVLAFASFERTVGVPFAFNPVPQNPGVSFSLSDHKRKVRDTGENDGMANYFQWYDLNGDKKVLVSEIKDAWNASFGLNWTEEANFKDFDADGDGALSEEEFRLYHTHGGNYYIFKLIVRDNSTNWDYFIRQDEMRSFLRKWGFPDEVTERLLATDFAKFDKNDDEHWDFWEFEEWYTAKGSDKEFAQEDFKALDDDSNGSVTPKELGKYLKSIGAVERISFAGFFISQADKNNDSLLTLEEYLAGFYGIQ